MYHNHLTDILFLAANHEYRFVPAAGPDWKGDFDLGKQPLKSIHEATADPAVLTAWAAKYKGCNWLYVPDDTQAVLDIDPRHGGDVLLAELEREHGPLPRSPQVRTGRGDGGRHRHFAVPGGLSFDADLRGNHGLTLSCGGKRGFVVPPCRHALGGQYAWELPPWDADPAPCPEWLLRLARADAPAAAKPPAGTEAAPTPVPPDLGPLEIVWGGGDRLAAHPGSVAKALGGKGRRPTLVSLLGRELGLDRSADDLEPEVLAWAGRCTPPLDEREALKHLHSMARRDAARHGEERHHARILLTTPANEGSRPEAPAEEGCCRAANHTSFLPSAGDAPAEPDEAPDFVRHGLVGEIARAVGPQLEGAVEPLVFCVLSCFGSATGPGPHVRTGAGRHRGNLFAVVVAPSGVGKSEPWNVCSALFEYAAPGWHAGAVGDGLGSGEGLIERLEGGPVLFAVEAEFGGLLARARRDGATLTATVCNAWDGRPLEVLNRGHAKLRATGHHVSLWGNVTDAELDKRLSGSVEAVCGFGNRFLWLRQRRVRYLPRGGDLRCLMDLAGPVREALARAEGIGEVRWGDEAGRVWDAEYQRLCDGQDGHWSLGRARSQALRLVLIYALLDGAEVIGPEHVAAGLSAWHWAERSARGIFLPPPVPAAVHPGASALTFVMGGVEQRQHLSAEIAPSADAPAPADERAVLADKVLGRITAKPGTGRGELMRAVNAKAAPLGDALAALHADGKAHPRLVPGKGRPAECWFPGPDPGDGTNEGSMPPTGPDPAADLPSFVWAGAEDAGSGTKEERPGDGEPPTGGSDFLPSFGAAEGRQSGDGGVGGVVQPELGPVPCPDKPPGRREPSAGWQASYEKAQVEYQQELRRRRGDDDPPMTEEQFFGELNKVRPRPPAA